MEKLQPMLFLVLFFCGCQPKESRSAFDNWQPPPMRSKVITAKSDEILAPGQKRPTITYVMPAPESPEIVVEPRVKQIIVLIADQRLYAYGDDRETPLASFPCSTAISGITYPIGYEGKQSEIHNHSGTFIIDRKDIDHVSGQYNCPMPYALHFYEGHWIHATEPRFYSQLGNPASHGCIRLCLDDAKWLYGHTPVGSRLTIR